MLRSAILKDINSAACSLVLKSLNDSRIQIAVYTANQSVANGTRDYFDDLKRNDNDFPRYHVEGTSFSVSDQNKIFSVDLRNQAPSYKVLESLKNKLEKELYRNMKDKDVAGIDGFWLLPSDIHVAYAGINKDSLAVSIATRNKQMCSELQDYFAMAFLPNY